TSSKALTALISTEIDGDITTLAAVSHHIMCGTSDGSVHWIPLETLYEKAVSHTNYQSKPIAALLQPTAQKGRERGGLLRTAESSRSSRTSSHGSHRNHTAVTDLKNT